MKILKYILGCLLCLSEFGSQCGAIKVSGLHLVSRDDVKVNSQFKAEDSLRHVAKKDSESVVSVVSRSSRESKDHPHHAEREHLEDESGALEEHAIAKYIVLPLCAALLLSLFLGGAITMHNISWMPESAVTLLIGVSVGIYMKTNIGHIDFFSDEVAFNKTCSTILTLFLLPVLIFEAGWSIRHKDFATQFVYIILFAVVGSLISFLVVGSLIMYTGSLGWHGIVHARTAFAYASLIAATDPVATLSTYSELKVDALLNIMVFGDSVFNDAVAIVLFKVLNNDAVMGTVDSRPSLQELSGRISWGIFSIFIGSLVLGFVVACLFLLLLKFFHLRERPRLEILALVAVAYGVFALGEVVHMSGIIATISCSMLLGIYARPHLSPGGSLLGNFFLSQLSGVFDRAVFLLTGVCFINLGVRGLQFGAIAMLCCLIGRACSVFPIAALSNWMKTVAGTARGTPEKDWNLLSPKAMFMMWHACLRGAIALTLCMQLGPWVDLLDGPETRHILQTATSFLICVFLLVFGGSTEALLVKLQIPMGEQTDPEKLYRKEAHGWIQSSFRWLDAKVMVPLFVGDERLAASVEDKDKNAEVEDVLSVAIKKQRHHKEKQEAAEASQA